MESNLTCPICLDLYTDPVALTCMHSFCRDCLLENLSSRSPPGTKDDNKIRVPCPNCKTEIPLSRNGIRGMQRNFQLESIVESFKKSQQRQSKMMAVASRGPPCDFCKESEGRSATKRCTKCEVSYCVECLKSFHPSRGPLASHTIIDISGAAVSSGAGAASAGAGARPPTLPKPRPRSGTPSTTGLLKAQLGRDLDELTRQVDSLKKSVEKLQKVKSNIENKTDKLKSGITTESGKLRDFVTKTANEQRGAIMEETHQKLMTTESQLRAHQDYLRKQQDLIDSVRALLKEPDDNAFHKTATTVKQKIQSSKGNRPRLDDTPGDIDLSQCTDILQAFKQRVQGFMQEEQNHDQANPPAQPIVSPDVCVCRSDSIAICVPTYALGGTASEASKIDTYGYKYKAPQDMEWKQAKVQVNQIENRGCIKIDTLTPSKQYIVSIQAHNSYGWSPWSGPVLLKTTDVVHAERTPAPSERGSAPRIDTTKTHVGSEVVILQWTPCIGSAANDAYIVAHSSADDGNEKWVYAVTQDSGNTFTIDGLTPGSSYLFKLSGCIAGGGGFSDWSKKVKIRLGQQNLPRQQDNTPQKVQPVQINETSFALDKQTAHPCLLISEKSINHPSNACPSLSDGFTDKCFSVFGNATFSSGVHYWEVIIHGEGSKVRVGIAKPDVTMNKPLGTSQDAWVLVMDARSPSDRQGSYVLHGNHMHKSGGKWIPYTNYIGIQLDYNQKEICFIQYEGPPSPITKRTSHGFHFDPPAKLKPVFAVDDKTDGFRLQVITDKMPPDCDGPRDPVQEMLAFLAQKHP